MENFDDRDPVPAEHGDPEEASTAEQLAALADAGARSWYGYVSMADGTRLAVVVWRPAGDQAYPTLLDFAPYANGASPVGGTDVKRFLDAGYAYLGANMRGTGCSEGTFSYYHPIEGLDGAELVEWAAAQPWSTGAIGMIGGSYGGHTQIAVAAQQPAHLKAIVPVSFEGNEYRDEVAPGGMMNVGLIGSWSFDDQPSLAAVGVAARRDNGDCDCHATRLEQAGITSYEEVEARPLYDTWWAERAIDELAGRVTVPALIMHGWQDEWIRPNGSIRVFKGLGSEHKRLLLQNGAHYIARHEFNQREQMRWLDRWVKGEQNGVEAEPPVKVFWEVKRFGDGDQGEHVPSWETTYEAWPPPGRTWRSLWLTADGALEQSDPAESEVPDASRSYLFPLGTELVGSNEQFAVPPPPIGSLSYRTAPLAEDLTILGAPQLTFYVSCEQADTDFMFVLKDVDPSGNTLFVQRSVLRGSMRAVDEDASTADEVIQSFAKADPMNPGEVYEIRLSLASVGHVVRSGHRLELSIVAPSTIPSPVWAFAPISLPSRNRIYHGTTYPSRLSLPIVPGEGSQAPAAPLGALDNQPWR